MVKLCSLLVSRSRKDDVRSLCHDGAEEGNRIVMMLKNDLTLDIRSLADRQMPSFALQTPSRKEESAAPVMMIDRGGQTQMSLLLV